MTFEGAPGLGISSSIYFQVRIHMPRIFSIVASNQRRMKKETNEEEKKKAGKEEKYHRSSLQANKEKRVPLIPEFLSELDAVNCIHRVALE